MVPLQKLMNHNAIEKACLTQAEYNARYNQR